MVPPGLMLEVFGDRDAVLRRVEDLVGCEVIVRGNEIVLHGDGPQVERAARPSMELLAGTARSCRGTVLDLPR